MTYINIYTKNIKDTADFYQRTGLFEVLADRKLISTIKEDHLIVDLCLSKKNYYISFDLYIEEEVNIIRVLEMNGIKHKLTQNLGGAYLSFCDNNLNNFFLIGGAGFIIR